jgi:hypothetical protein
VLLNGGLGKQLFNKYRTETNKFRGEYKPIILAALLMSVGANIDNTEMNYLREIFPSVCFVICPTTKVQTYATQIENRNGFALPICDEGFRDPGKIQFKAMMDNYENGKPYLFTPR